MLRPGQHRQGMGGGRIDHVTGQTRTRGITFFLRELDADRGYPVNDADEFLDAVQAYRRAMDDADYVRDAWIEAGRPLIQETPNGALRSASLVAGDVGL